MATILMSVQSAMPQGNVVGIDDPTNFIVNINPLFSGNCCNIASVLRRFAVILFYAHLCFSSCSLCGRVQMV